MKKRYWGIFTTVLVGIVLLLAIFLVAFRLLGFEIYTVMSGSMEPAYHVGSLIYVKPINTDELKEGDVITFLADKDNTIVTHRIIEVTNENNATHFRTKGDANDVPDAKSVHYKNVLGKPEFTIPLLGYSACCLWSSIRLFMIKERRKLRAKRKTSPKGNLELFQ